jgi:hypothetical protein
VLPSQNVVSEGVFAKILRSEANFVSNFNGEKPGKSQLEADKSRKMPIATTAKPIGGGRNETQHRPHSDHACR